MPFWLEYIVSNTRIVSRTNQTRAHLQSMNVIETNVIANVKCHYYYSWHCCTRYWIYVQPSTRYSQSLYACQHGKLCTSQLNFNKHQWVKPIERQKTHVSPVHLSTTADLHSSLFLHTKQALKPKTGLSFGMLSSSASAPFRHRRKRQLSTLKLRTFDIWRSVEHRNPYTQRQSQTFYIFSILSVSLCDVQCPM